jgi:predicted enzyme related to lactoylglutathione lyase
VTSRQCPVVWFEIPVADLQSAAQFYGGLFGWEFESFEAYDSDYWTIKGEDTGVGGALVLDRERKPKGSAAIIFVAVDDLDHAVQKVLQLEGGVVKWPALITESAGSFAIVKDPDGNSIGLWCR